MYFKALNLGRFFDDEYLAVLRYSFDKGESESEHRLAVKQIFYIYKVAFPGARSKNAIADFFAQNPGTLDP